mmetsp:Transcript_23517/g.61864  ORF Transcript_23517/g.61864 Transcript_23517/m.61864 type:complete len:212 (+) Transcript_23517:990-1625(+)
MGDGAESDDGSQTRGPRHNLPSTASMLTQECALKKSSVMSFPAPFMISPFPPGWKSMYEVISYTLPWKIVQASPGFLCLPTSSAVSCNPAGRCFAGLEFPANNCMNCIWLPPPFWYFRSPAGRSGGDCWWSSGAAITAPLSTSHTVVPDETFPSKRSRGVTDQTVSPPRTCISMPSNLDKPVACRTASRSRTTKSLLGIFSRHPKQKVVFS